MTMGRLKLAGDKQFRIIDTQGLDSTWRHLCVRTDNMLTFSEQDSLIGREFALNGELQQVITSPTDVLFILFVPSEPP